MKEDKIELTEKRYKQLEKRRNEIWKLKRALPYKPIKPYQDGWVLVIDIIDEAKRRDDADKMLIALGMCRQNNCVVRDPKKISRVRKAESLSAVKAMFTHQYKEHTYYDGPEISSIKEKEWEAAIPSVKKLFSKTIHRRILPWGGQEIITISYQLSIPNHYLCVKVKKRMVTQIQDIDPKLAKEEKEIEDELQPYYRSFGHEQGWMNRIENKRKRRHVKDALRKVKAGEIAEISQYSKVVKNK